MHRCQPGHGKGICRAQREFARRRIDELIVEFMPEFSLKQHISAANLAAVGARHVSGMVVALGTVVAFGSLLAAAGGHFWSLAAFPALVFVATFAYSDWVRLQASSRMHGFVGFLLRNLGHLLQLLKDSHPWRPLRTFALLLFLVGGHFDLLSS